MDSPNNCSAIPLDIYQTCAVPEFEWAIYSTKTTARMYSRKDVISGNYLFAAGYLKSTIDLNENTAKKALKTIEDFIVSGPYTHDNPTGKDAKKISVNLISDPAVDGMWENAEGSFGQWEIGIVKLDITTGEPLDTFIYSGHGFDETTGLAAFDDMIVVSGHFTSNLTAAMMNGTLQTIFNSNLMENGRPNPNNKYHPNNKNGAGKTGSDDGFVIKADSKTGRIIRYPVSNKDS